MLTVNKRNTAPLTLQCSTLPSLLIKSKPSSWTCPALCNFLSVTIVQQYEHLYTIAGIINFNLYTIAMECEHLYTIAMEYVYDPDDWLQCSRLRAWYNPTLLGSCVCRLTLRPQQEGKSEIDWPTKNNESLFLARIFINNADNGLLHKQHKLLPLAFAQFSAPMTYSSLRVAECVCVCVRALVRRFVHWAHCSSCVCTIYINLQELCRMVQHSKVFAVSFENPFRPEDERQSRRSRKR